MTNSERILSLVGAIPFANYLKGGKNFKNGQKPNVLQKISKAATFVAKTAKSVSKIIRNKMQWRLWYYFSQAFV